MSVTHGDGSPVPKLDRVRGAADTPGHPAFLASLNMLPRAFELRLGYARDTPETCRRFVGAAAGVGHNFTPQRGQ